MATTTYSNALTFGTTTNASGMTEFSDIDNAIVPFLAATRFTIENETVMTQLVRTVSLPKKQGLAWREPKMGTVTASPLTTGVDMQQSQRLQDSIWSVTPAEVGVQLVFTDEVLDYVRDDQMSIGGKLAGDAISRKTDQDGISTFQASTTGLGSAGTATTWGHIAAGESAVTGAAEKAPGPIHYVNHAHTFHPLAKLLAPTGTYPIPAGISQEIVENGFMNMKSLGGTFLWRDNNITKDGSDDAIGGLFSKEAFLYVKAFGPNTEKERDTSLRAWEVNTTVKYGWGIYQQSWTRKMTFDAVTPTS